MNIALIVGGISAEREVSLSSGRGILKALRDLGHNVKVIDPVFGDKAVSEEKIFSDIIKKEYPNIEDLEKLKKSSYRNILNCINSSIFDDIDIVFIGLHGKFGEDGKIQSLLEIRGKKYTGTGVLASGMAMDKNISKIFFKYNNVPTADWILIQNENVDAKKIVTEFSYNISGYEILCLTQGRISDAGQISKNKIHYPCVVKPNDEGSTVGLSIVNNENELKDAINLAFSFSDKVLIEEYIKGRELTVTILGDEALPVIEIKPKNGFYDYHHKYTKGMTDYVCPAEINENIAGDVRKYALIAHKSLGCSVYSRVDFILNGKDELFCLEVNTLPGMTELSLVPKAAKANGIEFTELIDRIINLSLNKN